VTPSVTSKPRYTHNQFGYSVGGPVKKDKIFFFSSTEWTKIRSAATDIAVVPTAAFLAMTNANTQAYFAKYGVLAHAINGPTYLGGSAQVAAVSGWGSTDVPAIVAMNPAFATTAAFGESIFSIPANSGGGDPVNQWVTFNRIDWTISPTMSAFVRYIQQSSIYPSGYVNASPYKAFNTSEQVANHNLLVSVSKAFSPRLGSTTKLLLARNNDSQPLGDQPVSPTLYVNPSATVGLGGGIINFPGYSQTSPGNAIPFGGPQNQIELAEDAAWTLGKHQFTFGGSYLYTRDNRTFGAYENAVDALVSSGSKNALLNLFNGNFAYLNVAINPQGKYPCAKSATTGATISVVGCQITLPVSSPNFSRSNRYHDFAFYAQDSYKVNSRLTVSAGLRWEIYGVQHSQQAGYDANFYPGAGNAWQEFAAGQVLTRDKAPNGRLWNLNLKQFAPKLGFALDPFGNGKTSIRAGFGINYERNFGNVTYNIIQNPPNYGVVSFTSADNGGALLPISTNNFSTMGTNTGTKNMPQVTLRAVDPNIKPAYDVNYTFSVQHQVGDTTLGVEYVGSRGIHNYSIANFNRSYAGSNYLGYTGGASLRPNLQYGSINYRGADGDSYYNSVNFSLRTNNLHHTGISGTTNFTYGHSIDNTSSTFTDGASNTMNGIAYLDPYNKRLDRGNSDFDQRYRVTSGLMWAVPTPKSLTGVAKLLAENWNLGTTFSASTGNPFSMFDCGLNVVTVCPRAAFTADPATHRTRNMKDISTDWGANTYSYISLPAYTSSNYYEQTNPNTGTADMPICSGLNGVGCHWVTNMSGRNAFSGPGKWGQDLSVLKDFKVHERYSVQFKAEFINLYNHANTYLNLGGYSDTSYTTDVLAYKDGNRNTELSVHVAF